MKRPPELLALGAIQANVVLLLAFEDPSSDALTMP